MASRKNKPSTLDSTAKKKQAPSFLPNYFTTGLPPYDYTTASSNAQLPQRLMAESSTATIPSAPQAQGALFGYEPRNPNTERESTGHPPYIMYPPPSWMAFANQLQESQRQTAFYNDYDADSREGATSPTEIELAHIEEVQHMGCTCKRTKCLKLYCQCFGVKIFCGKNCRCLDCHNNVEHEKQRNKAMGLILLRNPRAFDAKFKRAATGDDENKVIAHKMGCKCKKSGCMKKYCECYAGSVRCTENCKCKECMNTEGNDEQFPLPILPSPASSTGRRKTQRTPARAKRPHEEKAAQSLAFLKSSSPDPIKRMRYTEDSPPTSAIKQAPIEVNEEHGAMLLLAAQAMTEIGQSPAK